PTNGSKRESEAPRASRLSPKRSWPAGTAARFRSTRILSPALPNTRSFQYYAPWAASKLCQLKSKMLRRSVLASGRRGTGNPEFLYEEAMSLVKVVVVIPARYAATRLPGKPLVTLAGKPMIQRVFERAKLAKTPTQVIVATDDDRIMQAVQAFGGEARLTRPEHRTGTERVAEVAAHVDGDVFVNVQGDEPLLDPAAVDTAVNAL